MSSNEWFIMPMGFLSTEHLSDIGIIFIQIRAL